MTLESPYGRITPEEDDQFSEHAIALDDRGIEGFKTLLDLDIRINSGEAAATEHRLKSWAGLVVAFGSIAQVLSSIIEGDSSNDNTRNIELWIGLAAISVMLSFWESGKREAIEKNVRLLRHGRSLLNEKILSSDEHSTQGR